MNKRKSKPFVVTACELSLAIADVQEELGKLWDTSFLRHLGPSKFPRWAAERRANAWALLAEWPVSLGGTAPDELWGENDL